jgi:hypothetical protein
MEPLAYFVFAIFLALVLVAIIVPQIQKGRHPKEG